MWSPCSRPHFSRTFLTHPANRPTHVIVVVLSLGILSAYCQTVSAEVVPSHPDHSWLFDEGIGDTTASHSDKFVATLQTGAAWSNYVRFGYQNNHSINVAQGEVITNGFPLESAGTISMWARSLSYGTHRYLLDGIDSQDPENTRTLLDLNLTEEDDLKKDPELLYINGQSVSCGPGNWATSDSFPKDQWHHIAIVWNNVFDTEVRIYLDGAQVASDGTLKVPITSNPSIWYFGKRYADGPERWQGQIDEYAFWNTALSSDEVLWLSNNSLVGLPEPCSLLLAAIGLIGLLVYGRRKRS